ncbi:type II secretion system protein [Lignipirellula cremea]|uniref:Type II secretion system protein G n=1 Tax=Lignipirellula cremea TaxID=2528010 RepID=A0A518DMH0_9BACT|nr:type II secretion system protein [Lignipirellula cremea]QDU93035.1 hypothetical protein Pla8534_08100 [Lignipirellula cremea]
MNSHLRKRPGGFTLVELLVVITIITILAGLTTVGIGAAIRSAHKAAIALEINELSRAVEAYYTKFGDYFPATVNLTNPSSANAIAFNKHLRKAFRNHTETPTSLTAALGNTSPGATLDAAETMVFFLGQAPTSLKLNPKLPVSGAGNPIALFTFNETRILDPDGDGFFSYYPKYGDGTFLAYFDHSSYAVTSFTQSGKGTVSPYFKSNTANDFINPETYQIISAGLDGQFGHVQASPNDRKVFPSGINYDPDGEDNDNIANFSEGRALEDLLP